LAQSGGAAGAGNEGGGSKEEDEALRAELEALGNHIRFFKNGKDQGPAYQQLIGGACVRGCLPACLPACGGLGSLYVCVRDVDEFEWMKGRRKEGTVCPA
jgi:hypothetical protein